MSIAKVYGRVLRVNEMRSEWTDKQNKNQVRNFKVALILDSDDVGRLLLKERSTVKVGDTLDGLPVRAGHYFIRGRGFDVLVEVDENA